METLGISDQIDACLKSHSKEIDDWILSLVPNKEYLKKCTIVTERKLNTTPTLVNKIYVNYWKEDQRLLWQREYVFKIKII